MDWKRLMKLTIIEAPFDADEKKRQWYTQLCIQDCFDRDESPFSADGFYSRYVDQDVMTQRAKSISAGLEWARYADIIAFYIDYGISASMEANMKMYKAQGKKIECRYIFKREENDPAHNDK